MTISLHKGLCVAGGDAVIIAPASQGLRRVVGSFLHHPGYIHTTHTPRRSPAALHTHNPSLFFTSSTGPITPAIFLFTKKDIDRRDLSTIRGTEEHR